jgi:hypothetical protein
VIGFHYGDLNVTSGCGAAAVVSASAIAAMMNVVARVIGDRHFANMLRHVGHILIFLSGSLLPHVPQTHETDMEEPITNRIVAKAKAVSPPA